VPSRSVIGASCLGDTKDQLTTIPCPFPHTHVVTNAKADVAVVQNVAQNAVALANNVQASNFQGAIPNTAYLPAAIHPTTQ